MSKLNEAIQIFLEEIGASSAPVNAVSTDSRTIKQGDLYIALLGENFDGHDFIDQALNQGASLALSQKTSGKNVVKVDDTLLAYHRIASIYRSLLNPILVAITGSNGKTTTKDLMSLCLSQKFKVYATEKNFNNEIGVPKTILAMPEDTEVLILEMGMRGLGQIDLLSRTAQPNIAVITNFGSAHIELLGSKENIKKAKLEIKNGLCQHQSLPETPLFYKAEDCEAYALPKMRCLLSCGLQSNINLVAKVAKSLGLSEPIINQALEAYNPGPGRGETIEKNGITYIDETYNSSPESIKNSVDAVMAAYPQQEKLFVLGDVSESDPALVDEAFAYVAGLEAKLLDLRGIELSAAQKLLQENLEGSKVLLLKASRSQKLEKLLP